MDTSLWKKQHRRSALRLAVSGAFFRACRWWQWRFDRRPQAKRGAADSFPFVVFSHESPLRRKLPGSPPELDEGKIINLGLACARLDGLVLRPGESLSYWRCIGKPSRRRGFRPGLVLRHGRLTAGIGGGLCQLSNLLYWMTVHTGLTVVERWRHSYDVFPDQERKVPFGGGATCVYNYRDLVIENRTADSYRLNLSLSDSELRGTWHSDHQPRRTYRVYEQSQRFDQAPNGAYLRHNRLFRQVLGENGVESDELLVENHALLMYQPFIAHHPRNN